MDSCGVLLEILGRKLFCWTHEYSSDPKRQMSSKNIGIGNKILICVLLCCHFNLFLVKVFLPSDSGFVRGLYRPRKWLRGSSTLFVSD